MKRSAFFLTALALSAAVVGCGGSDAPATQAGGDAPDATTAAPSALSLSVPEWYQIDEAARTVTLRITAGATNVQNYWNFNGFAKGSGASIIVPEGYAVTLEFTNQDPNMAHSVGIEEWRESNWPGSVEVSPEFPGAVSSNPGSLIDSTMPGESETLQFEVDRAGEYAMVCYVPGHATIGMFVKFVVSSDGTAGVMM